MMSYAGIGVWLIPALAAIYYLHHKTRRGKWMVAALGLSNGLFYVWTYAGQKESVSWQWLSIMDLELRTEFSLSSDLWMFTGLTLALTFLTTLYSVKYMSKERHRSRYFALIGVFTSSIVGLLWANDGLSIWFFWESMSLTSALLVGHTQTEKSLSKAAWRAYLMTKLTDLPLIVLTAMLALKFGTLDLHVLQTNLSSHDTYADLWGVLLVIAGLGKAAQWPLQGWLLLAMRGPTPVSALLHSATLVAAGPILLMKYAFLLTPLTQHILLFTALFTALWSICFAHIEQDAKKLLAFSTLAHMSCVCILIAQLQFSAALLYLSAHGLAKWLLFLCIASEGYASGERSTSLSLLGGRAHQLPIVYLCIIIATSSLVGTPFTIGYLAKHTFWVHSSHSTWLLAAAVVLSIGTGSYMGRFLGCLWKKSRPSSLALSSDPIILYLVLLIGAGAACVWPFLVQNTEKTVPAFVDVLSFLPLIAFGISFYMTKYRRLTQRRYDGSLLRPYYFLAQLVRSLASTLSSLEKHLTYMIYGIAKSCLLTALLLRLLEKEFGEFPRRFAKIFYKTGKQIGYVSVQNFSLRVGWAIFFFLLLFWLGYSL